MLRALIGTDAFWRGIRLYYQQYMNGVASTADLRRTMEEVSGRDLGGFFDEWLTRSGVPELSGGWRYDAAAKQVVVTVRQTQAGDPFQLSLDVGVTMPARRTGTADGPPREMPAIHRFDVTGRESTFRIPADVEPASVVLDPGVWLLADVRSFERTGR